MGCLSSFLGWFWLILFHMVFSHTFLTLLLLHNPAKHPSPHTKSCPFLRISLFLSLWFNRYIPLLSPPPFFLHQNLAMEISLVSSLFLKSFSHHTFPLS